MGRPNLRVVTGAEIEQVVFEGRRAAGVAFRQGGRRFVARASGEVLLATGAVASPKLLELSGVGDGARLRELGIDIVRHAPGVGENLQDHLQLRPVYKVSGVRTLNTDYANLAKRAAMGLAYALFRQGPLTMAPSQLGVFAKSSDRYETANLEFHFQPLSLDRWGEGLHPFGAITASVCNLRPTSRGSVHATSREAAVPPRIAPNYLSTEDDLQVAEDALRLARRIAAAPPLGQYRPEEYRPGPAYRSAADLRRAAAEIGTTIFHPVGTAAMGPDSDPMAVLDARLRVRGVDNLRVVDASAMPRITSGNTNSPVIMIAEKAAAMILEDGRLA
jgi:choline dehydrogenase-like flavoprotein